MDESNKEAPGEPHLMENPMTTQNDVAITEENKKESETHNAHVPNQINMCSPALDEAPIDLSNKTESETVSDKVVGDISKEVATIAKPEEQAKENIPNSPLSTTPTLNSPGDSKDVTSIAEAAPTSSSNDLTTVTEDQTDITKSNTCNDITTTESDTDNPDLQQNVIDHSPAKAQEVKQDHINEKNDDVTSTDVNSVEDVETPSALKTCSSVDAPSGSETPSDVETPSVIESQASSIESDIADELSNKDSNAASIDEKSSDIGNVTPNRNVDYTLNKGHSIEILGTPVHVPAESNSESSQDSFADMPFNSQPTSIGSQSQAKSPSNYSDVFKKFLESNQANDESDSQDADLVQGSEDTTATDDVKHDAVKADETLQDDTVKNEAATPEDAAVKETSDVVDEKTETDKPDTKEKKKAPKKKRRGITIHDDDGGIGRDVGAVDLFDYQWPQDDKHAEQFVLQEQVSNFLGILSFKRKYPELTRRPVEMHERDFLKERGIVTEMQCDLGLTAIKLDDVCDLMHKDYPEKYSEFAMILADREKRRVQEKQKEYKMARLDKNKMESYMKKAVKSAADFNARLMRERREERRAYFDLQTQCIQWSTGKVKRAPPEFTKVGAYPVALLQGQYTDEYRKYTPDELKYFPINTSTYGAPKRLDNVFTEGEGIMSDTESQTSETKATFNRIEEIIRQVQRDPDGAQFSTGSTDSENEGSSSDSSSDSESDSAMDSANEGLSGHKKMKMKMYDKCQICDSIDNRNNHVEEVVTCAECNKIAHPTCFDVTEEMIPIIKTYPWQCMECKTCVECMDPYDEDKMMFCDHCDRGYHTFCVGLRNIPSGRWECASCTPGGPPKPKKVKR
ncbi:unnamed protein product [Owenia fusiformis]|uniref:PHD finger protein 10 n=1 Tax=Owenia fusiformis TaxID=6347 RepID=A0A8J1XWP0_OWEFU|nr:unnamed protein product [Owenia fusiformis]